MGTNGKLISENCLQWLLKELQHVVLPEFGNNRSAYMNKHHFKKSFCLK